MAAVLLVALALIVPGAGAFAQGPRQSPQLNLPKDRWTPVDITVGQDGKSRILWGNGNGHNVVSRIAGTESQIEIGQEFFASEWIIDNISIGPKDGLWALWNYRAGGASTVSFYFDPIFQLETFFETQMFANWVGASIAGHPAQARPRHMWRGPQNEFILSTLSLSGPVDDIFLYGPYPDYFPANMVVDAAGNYYVLLNHIQGYFQVWKLNAATGVLDRVDLLGVFPGWSAREIAVGPVDGKIRVLLNNVDGQFALWTLSATTPGTLESDFRFPAMPGWTAVGISVGFDNLPRVLLSSVNGPSAIWTISTDGTVLVDIRFPFIGR